MKLQFISLIIFSVIDFIATRILIIRHGMTMELNPLLLYFMEHTETPWAILWFKCFMFVIIGLVFVGIELAKNKPRPIFKWALNITVLWQVLVSLLGVFLVIADH